MAVRSQAVPASRGGHSHKHRSHGCDRGQGLFLVSVKRSRTISKLGNSGQDINVLRVRIAHGVVKCVRSNGQAVKQQKRWSKFFDPGRSSHTVCFCIQYAIKNWRRERPGNEAIGAVVNQKLEAGTAWERGYS